MAVPITVQVTPRGSGTRCANGSAPVRLHSPAKAWVERPAGMSAPDGRELPPLRVPAGIVLVPVAHDLVHAAPVDAAREAALVLDPVAEERGARRHRVMVDIAV
jgi:hypothetical protein